ncbi:MAG: T9SS type A sorting domain-containing protein [Bacteroidota bacterium]
MKNLFTTLILLGLTFPVFSQVLNNEISILYRITQTYTIAVDESDNEWTMTFQHQVDGEGEGVDAISLMDGDVGNNTSIAGLNIVEENVSYSDIFALFVRGWEDDSFSDEDRDTYDDGDDQYYQGTAVLDGGCVPCASPPAEWNTDPANVGGAAWVGSTLVPQTGLWDFKYQIIWRYMNGDNLDEPLLLGDLVAAGERFDLNSNNQLASPSGGLTNYTNQYSGSPSADVYYSFSLSDAREVTLSTNHSETAFDTHLFLLDADGNLLADNDDVASGNLRSTITEALCPGQYYVVVEGFDAVSDGVFRLTAEAGGFLAPLDDVFLDLTNATCDDATDGAAMATPDGGIAPYQYFWFDSDAQIQLGSGNDLYPGNFIVQIFDACGTEVSEAFSIEAEDTIFPEANCPDFTVDVPELPGVEYLLDTTTIASFSTDNCGAVFVTDFAPMTYGSDDAPDFTYSITISDQAGNLSSCLGTVSITVVTSVDQDEELATAVDIFPNPTTDLFTIRTQELELERGQLFLRDMNGRIVYEKDCPDTRTWQEVFDISHLAAGIYTLQIRSGQRQLTRRIIKQ